MGTGEIFRLLQKDNAYIPDNRFRQRDKAFREQKEKYGKRRISTVEPVFANTSSNKGLNRFSLRGKTKVQGQWQLYCLVHNIEKIKNYGAIA